MRPGPYTGHRPCGACGRYVRETVGCAHWRPLSSRPGASSPVSAAERGRQHRERERRRLYPELYDRIREELRSNVREGMRDRPEPAPKPIEPEARRARNRRYEKDAHERARDAIADFRRMMNRGVTG